MEYAVGALTIVVMSLFGWGVTIGNRVSVLETLLSAKWDDISRRLERIEKHLNGSL